MAQTHTPARRVKDGELDDPSAGAQAGAAGSRAGGAAVSRPSRVRVDYLMPSFPLRKKSQTLVCSARRKMWRLVGGAFRQAFLRRLWGFRAAFASMVFHPVCCVLGDLPRRVPFLYASPSNRFCLNIVLERRCRSSLTPLKPSYGAQLPPLAGDSIGPPFGASKYAVPPP